MESFPDRTYVRLWMREYGEYLYAGEDGESITRSQYFHGALRAAWAVHRLVRGGTDYVLFHSAAYGRYLALNESEAQDGDEADVEYYYIAGQSTYESPEQVNVLFQARRANDGTDDIFLSNPRFGDWYRSGAEDGDTPIHWVVEAIPASPLAPELPHPIQIQLAPMPGSRRLQLAPQVVLRRTIFYVRADDQGNFNRHQWGVLEQFEGQSVFNLRIALAAALGEANDNDLGITLCVRAGANGRWTPLVIDLPSDENPMWIVVLTTGSPAALALRHPNVDAQ